MVEGITAKGGVKADSLMVHSNWVYSTWETRFYNYGELCRVASVARG